MEVAASPYPPDGWAVRELSFDPEMIARNETIFALGNGHLGLRGNLEEGRCNAVEGTYLNGFYEESPIVYGEVAYGYAKNRQVMLNVANGKIIRLSVGGDPLDLSTGTILAHERRLDLRSGLLSRCLRWRSPGGAEVELETRRLVSFVRPEVAAIDYLVKVRVGRRRAELRIESEVDGDTSNQVGSDDPRIGAHFRDRPLRVSTVEAGALSGLVVQETTNTRFGLACAFDHLFVGERPSWLNASVERLLAAGAAVASDAAGLDARGVRLVLSGEFSGEAELHFTKVLAYCTTLDGMRVPDRGARGERGAGTGANAVGPFGSNAAQVQQGAEPSTEAIKRRAREVAAAAAAEGFEGLAAEQRAELDRFWETADVTIEGDETLQQSIRYNLFSLYQSAGRDGRTSIAAKGLTGEGYEGHYFWDTEIYVLPIFTYLQPQIARVLVEYRLAILDKARARAAEMSQRGALFPWRTIGGEETSPYYPAGTAQYHINADIVYAFRRYVASTGDTELLRDGGAEMLFETARLWADLGHYSEAKGGDFCIDEVTGPNEYTALVNNNLYTNLMAQANLEYAVEVAERLRSESPADFARIAAAINLDPVEIDGWRRAAERMHVPFDPGRGIHKQDDLFLDRAVWNFERTPAANYPLLLHYHPLVIYRHQVLKQPDVVLAQVLLGGRFTMAEKRRNFEYYDPITTGDSSLSPCIQSVAAAELGYTEKAYGYFMRTARMDLDDVNGNVAAGVHTAAMAGTWISLIYGFAGMRDDEGRLSFSPRLPGHWSRLAFRLCFRGSRLQVDLGRREATYTLLSGEPLSIVHRKHPITLEVGRSISISLVPRLECVIFDLDGVITDTAEYHFQAWKRLADELRLPFDRKVNERLKGVSRLESLGIILEHGGRAASEEERRELADRKNRYYRELIGRITPADLLPGVGELLGELRAASIKIAIASVSHNVWEVVRRLDIGGMIDHVVDPALVAKGKPDPEIFYRAAEALEAPFESCAGIEDAAAGVAAIRSAGMFAIGIGMGLGEADLRLADTHGLTLPLLRREFDRWADTGLTPASGRRSP